MAKTVADVMKLVKEAESSSLISASPTPAARSST
jgi:hypothetical protein